MAVYSIKDLEKLSGIKAHTLRMWESRYDLLQPSRTPTNIRYYDDDDLKFLLNIALLNKDGFRISVIARMSKSEIAAKVSEISAANNHGATQLDAMTLAMVEMDEAKFDRILSANIKQLGFEQSMIQVVLPFLDKLGLLWLTGSIRPVQESFISALIRQKIIVAIDKLPLVEDTDAEKYIIYLPEKERQELTLLFLHYIIKSRGKRVVYLGQEISIYDLKDACEIHNPDFLFTMITESYSQGSVQGYLNKLKVTFNAVTILATGYQVLKQGINSNENLVILESLNHTLEFLKTSNPIKQA